MPTMYDEVLKVTGFAESSHLITRESLDKIDPREREAVEQRYLYS